MFALSPSDPHRLTSARGACMLLWMSVLFPLCVLNLLDVCLHVVALQVLLYSQELNCWTHVGCLENVSDHIIQ